MRIAFLNWTPRAVGGIETYIASVMRECDRRGIATALVYESEGPEDRPAMELPAQSILLSASKLGLDNLIGELKAWNPDLVFAHGHISPDLEMSSQTIAPSLYFIHNYHGTCISGLKTNQFPTVRPCNRTLGPACLALYLPLRCGGTSPLTMFKLYNRETARLKVLRRYHRLITHSEHMRQEYLRHGFPADRVLQLDFAAFDGISGPTSARDKNLNASPQLLWAGRMDRLKGGELLIQSLPLIQKQLRRPVHLTFAGDGPDRKQWEKSANEVLGNHTEISVTFAGWLSGSRMQELYRQADLFVLPSLWPEPFGKVGPEAGLFGVPAVAFPVGGVRAWLENGVNGVLADSGPPSASVFAKAATAVLEDETRWRRLSIGSIQNAARFEVSRHVDALESIFQTVLKTGPQTGIVSVQ